MAETSNIGWTDATLNPYTWRCDHASPGCDHCYAETLTNRWQGDGAFTSGPPDLRPSRLLLPWISRDFRDAERVFLCSMSDPFHPGIDADDQAAVWAMMAAARGHTWQVLTKRHGPMRARLNSPHFVERIRTALDRLEALVRDARTLSPHRRQAIVDIEHARRHWVWPLPGVHLGVSVEDQARADLRLPALMQTPAAVRWLSAEPLLGPVKLNRLHSHCPVHDFDGGWCSGPCEHLIIPDWCVAGGESGSAHRAMDITWLTDLADQCAAKSIRFYAKQDSGRHPGRQDRIPDEYWIHQHPEPLALAATEEAAS